MADSNFLTWKQVETDHALRQAIRRMNENCLVRMENLQVSCLHLTHVMDFSPLVRG